MITIPWLQNRSQFQYRVYHRHVDFHWSPTVFFAQCVQHGNFDRKTKSANNWKHAIKAHACVYGTTKLLLQTKIYLLFCSQCHYRLTHYFLTSHKYDLQSSNVADFQTIFAQRAGRCHVRKSNLHFAINVHRVTDWSIKRTVYKAWLTAPSFVRKNKNRERWLCVGVKQIH